MIFDFFRRNYLQNKNKIIICLLKKIKTEAVRSQDFLASPHNNKLLSAAVFQN